MGVNGDHLGNIRLSYKDADKDGAITQDEIVEEKNYYPFGMLHSGYNFAVNGSKHNYGFNGMEEHNELSLNWLDFDARNFDATIGRWMNIDPLADDMTRHSPYNFAFDNPIYYIDPDGMSPRVNFGGDGSDDNQDFSYEFNNFASTYVDGTGQIIHYEDDGDDGIYLVTNPANGLNKNWQIGTERAGQTYTPGNYLDYDDLSANYQNSPQALPGEFQLATYPIDVESQILMLWATEWIGGEGLIKFKGLVQNMLLRGLTHQQIVKAFAGSGFKLSNHAIKRLKDLRTQKLGFKTLNDVKQIFNKGSKFNSRSGTVGYSYKGMEVIINPKTKVIITFRPAKNIR